MRILLPALLFAALAAPTSCGNCKRATAVNSPTSDLNASNTFMASASPSDTTSYRSERARRRKEIFLHQNDDFSPTNLLITYDPEVGDGPVLKAVEEYGATIIYKYSIFNGLAIKIPEGGDLDKAREYFKKVKGVLIVEKDHYYHLDNPIKKSIQRSE